MSDDLFLGIDAGNTKTLALLVNRRGEVMGAGRAGPCNIYVSRPKALAALVEAATSASHAAGLRQLSCAAVTLSATGADFPEDFALLREALGEWNWAPSVDVVNDAVGALRAGTPAGLGVCVACGTSTGTAARVAGKAAWHSSYWQEPEGAEQLAQFTLRAVYRAHLEIDPPTALTAPVLSHFACANVPALLHLLNSRITPKPQHLGRLARVLLDVAHQGDATALRIVEDHGTALGDYALLAARQVGLHGVFPVITCGGVMRHPSPIMRQAMMKQFKLVHPDAVWQAGRLEPVYGAALLALETGGVPINEEQFATMEGTVLPSGFFES